MGSDRNRQEPLVELLEWREALPGWQWRPSWDYLEELLRLCAIGLIEVYGRPVLDNLSQKVGERQPVPPEAFDDYRLFEEIITFHGELCDRLLASRWVDLRFPNDTRRVWQAALETGELRAPRIAGRSLVFPPAEGAQSTPAACAKATREKPGPKPKIRKASAAKMLADLKSRRRTPEQLKADTHEALSKAYGGSNNTAKLAREDALSEFSEFLRVKNSGEL